MSENTTIEVMTEYPSRLQVAMLAPVKAIAAAIPEGDKEVRVVGYVFGEARGISWRNNPNSADGQASGGLIGVFEGIPAYADFAGMNVNDACAKRARLASAICFLPTQAQEAVIKAVLGDHERPANEQIKRGQRADVLGVSVPINVEIGIRKSGSPVGYEWVVRGLARVSAVDPIERMRAVMGTGPGADLAARVTAADKGALPAPSKSADKKTPARKRGK